MCFWFSRNRHGQTSSKKRQAPNLKTLKQKFAKRYSVRNKLMPRGEETRGKSIGYADRILRVKSKADFNFFYGIQIES